SRVRNRATLDTGAPGRRQQLRAIDDLHDAIVADAIGEIDAVESGTRCGNGIAAVPRERLGRPGRNRAVDLRDQGKVLRQHAGRLLPVKRPIPKKLWVRGVAEIKDEDMVFVARLPAIGRVNTASTDDVSDPRVALPPTLVSGDEIPDNRVAPGYSADADWFARIRHVPNLVRRAGKAAEHIDLGVSDRQRAAV